MTQTVLITGANRGLGLEFAKQYAADGWNVIACCRNPAKADALQKLATEHTSIKIETLDISQTISITSLAGKLGTAAIDILINNAGIFSGTGRDGKDFIGNGDDPTQNFGSLDAEKWARVMHVNMISPLMLTQALLANLKAGKQKKVIMISSGMGSITLNLEEGAIAYRSSKAGLNAAMHSVATTLSKEGFIIVSLRPGWVKTDMGGGYANLTPEQSVGDMKKVITKLKPENAGQFLDLDGSVVPW